jgi:hypothetical protein
MNLLREDIRDSLVQAGQKACGYMNCKLFVQTVTGVPKLDELPSRPFSSEADLVAGDVLKWGTGQHWAIYIDNGDIMEVEEWGAESRTVPLAEVLEEMDPPDMVFSTAESQHEGLLRKYIRELLVEDPMGFVHDLAAASEEFGEEGEMFFGGDPGKGGGKAIKRAFNANADHQFLSTLDTVHWVEDAYSLEYLIGKSKDELSTTMTLPGDKLKNPPGMLIGLWVKGRVTLAANDHDQLFSGKWPDYTGPHADYTEEEQEQRQKSSGVNKLPHVSKDFSRYGNLKRGDEFAEKMARNMPYVLDKSTWHQGISGETNEALVDNWKPVGIVVGKWVEPIKLSVQSLSDEKFKDNAGVNAPGVIGEIFKLATELGVPIFDRGRNELWSPE